MDNFCEICTNLLTFVHEEHRTVKMCRYCNKPHNTTATDSLRYQKKKGSNIAIQELELKNAEKDPVNKKISCKCKSCGHKIARLIRTSTMQTFVICIKCSATNPYSDSLFE